jgi:hypothetical protein
VAAAQRVTFGGDNAGRRGARLRRAVRAGVVAACLAALLPVGNAAAGSITFRPVASYPAGGGIPLKVVTGDVNGDGRLDVVAQVLDVGLSVLLGNGDGSLQDPVVYPTCLSVLIAQDIALLDIDHDGALDVAALCSQTITFLLNDGQGGLSAPVAGFTSHALVGAARYLATADLDANGYGDLVVTYDKGHRLGARPAALRVFTGPSLSPTMTIYPDYSYWSGGYRGRYQSFIPPVLGDFNGDGAVDLVTVDHLFDSYDWPRQTVFWGDGSGSFEYGAESYADWGISSAGAAGDLDGNGTSDAVYGSWGGAQAFFFDPGTWSFASLGHVPRPDDGQIGALGLADFDGDGRLDLVAAVPALVSHLSVYAGNGDGSFAAPLTIPAADLWGNTLTTGDLDGDGRPDIVAASLTGSVLVYLSRATARASMQALLAAIDAELATAGKRDRPELRDAERRLAAAVAPENWLDGDHLSAKPGARVFEDGKQAVEKLEQLLKDRKSGVADATLESWIVELLAVNEALARGAIADATAAGGDPKKLAEAEKELAKAADALARGKRHDAVAHYGNAWKKAQEALKKAL